MIKSFGLLAMVAAFATLAGCVRPSVDPRLQDLEPVRLCPNGEAIYRLDDRLVTIVVRQNGLRAGRREVKQTFAREATVESVC